jgi:amidohydrolase
MGIDFLQDAAALKDQLTAWRRDLHQYPELSFEEHRTAGVVTTELRNLGLEVQSGVGQTGVVGLLEGDNDGPTVLIRCDMDALPIHEANAVPYVSANEGVMHACGHDGHTAIGMGVAHLLHQKRSQINGRVKFVFQPAEEIALGAQAMIDDGVLNAPEPDVALGLHLWNTIPFGQVGITPGPIMAGADIFEITIQGAGGHGASPHETHDPLLAAAQLVTALQSIVSRNVDPLDTAVLSVTSISAGTAFNVIPHAAHLKGTIRTYRKETREHIITRMKDISHHVAQAMGCTAVVKVDYLTPPLNNDQHVTEKVQEALAPYIDQQHVRFDERTMGAEDMAVFLDAVPGCFLLVGSANAAAGLDYPHHHPQFDFDEAALPFGAALLASAAAAYVMPE